MPDADENLTAENVVASYTGCAGQRCMAASVLVAVGDVDHLLKAIVERSKKLVLGETLGPIITKQSQERIEGYIGGAEKEGAKILVDGRGQRGPGDGYWVGGDDHRQRDRQDAGLAR